MEEMKIPFYTRREFRYLAIACIALIVTAVGALFYNKHPKKLKPERDRMIQNEMAPADDKITTDTSFRVKDN